LGAMGQLFYSMSLAMGIMITYGSYMKKDISIPSSARNVAIFYTIVATLASLMVIPAVFAFSGGNQEALTSGPGLMFATLPKVFEAMPGGTIVAIAFFIMVFFAAITSSISLMEAVVSIFCDKFKMKRYPAIFTVLGISLLLGCVSSLGYSAWSGVTVIGMQFLDFFDFISNSVIMPIVAFLTCIMVGYIVKPQAVLEEVELNGKFSWKPVFNVVIKYVAPICIVAILVSSVLSAYGIIKI